MRKKTFLSKVAPKKDWTGTVKINKKPYSLQKRRWVYVQSPTAYECTCNLCGGSNITWSEFRHMIWCYDCQMDVRGNPGIFGGPIPMEVSKMLGIYFDRIHLKTGRILNEQISPSGKRIVWKFDRGPLATVGQSLMRLEAMTTIFEQMKWTVNQILKEMIFP